MKAEEERRCGFPSHQNLAVTKASWLRIAIRGKSMSSSCISCLGSSVPMSIPMTDSVVRRGRPPVKNKAACGLVTGGLVISRMSGMGEEARNGGPASAPSGKVSCGTSSALRFCAGLECA
ncbi:hypothetical protein RvY_03026 [Ramazzottius varieornatus]|uniref:Uncharacterized protein n=1 Tax=Ramazzottius varieornatus TaxID=947166 RepID=A0A1D1UTR1_RAMVA|nr:hypothetical protein RvY_03026 [Ramazzottius varieornatus]